MKIIANKEEVLATIRKNAEQHKKIFEEATEGYLKKIKKELLKHLERAENKEVYNIFIRHTPPENHLKQYERAVKMLEMHNGETIELGDEQVETLILDNWKWKNHFMDIAATYSDTAQKTQ